MGIFYVLLLTVSVSLDALAAGTAYGFRGVRLGLASLLVVGLVTTSCTAAAMIGAQWLDGVMDTHAAMLLGAGLMMLLGLWNLLQEYLAKRATAEGAPRALTIPLGRLVVLIMLNPETADLDDSKDISPREALLLGAALGVDNMVACFAASLMGILPGYTPVVMGLGQMMLIAAGAVAVRWLDVSRIKKNLPFLPGTILIVLGLLRLK